MSHTPTPWAVHVYGARSVEIHSDVLPAIVAVMPDANDDPDLPADCLDNAEAQANAAFIVCACNAHDELVAALDDLNESTEQYLAAPSIDRMNNLTESLRSARAALGKAKP